MTAFRIWLDDDRLDFARLFRGGGDFALHELLIAMVNNELEDQVLESFIDICWVTSWVR
jgi:hypothetical protein